MNRIKKLRKENNLTQKELGEIVKVSDRSIGFYESGERDPDTKTLSELADYFDVSTDYLLGRSAKRKSDGSITAYHIDADGLTEEEIEAVENIIEFYKQKHKK